MTANTGDWQKALELLRPLQGQIDAALATGNVDAAMHLAFARAAEAASLVSEAPAKLTGGRMHRVYVELAPQELVVYDDGTLVEQGTYVSLAYQCHELEPGEAEMLAGRWDESPGLTYWTVDST